MALQHSTSTDIGVEFPSAYSRISSINYTHAELIVSVNTHANHQARLDEKQPLKSQSFSIPWADSISIQGCYDALKDDPYFTDALDV